MDSKSMTTILTWDSESMTTVPREAVCEGDLSEHCTHLAVTCTCTKMVYTPGCNLHVHKDGVHTWLAVTLHVHKDGVHTWLAVTLHVHKDGVHTWL